MFPERLLCQISRSNTNEAFPPTMQPVFCLSTRTEDMTSIFGKGRPLTKKKHWFDWHKNLSGGDDFPHCFNCFDFLSCGKEKYVNLSGSGYKFMLLPTTVKPSCIYFSNCTVPQMRLLSWHGHEQPVGDGTFFTYENLVYKLRCVKIGMESVIYACVPMCHVFFLAVDNSVIFVSDTYLRSLGGVPCIWQSCFAGLFSEPKTSLQRYIDGCWKSIFSFMFMLFCTVPMCFVGFLVGKLSEKHLTKKMPFFVFVINHENSRPSVLNQTCRCENCRFRRSTWEGGFFWGGGSLSDNDAKCDRTSKIIPLRFNSSPLKSYRDPIGKNLVFHPPLLNSKLLNFGGIEYIKIRWGEANPKDWTLFVTFDYRNSLGNRRGRPWDFFRLLSSNVRGALREPLRKVEAAPTSLHTSPWKNPGDKNMFLLPNEVGHVKKYEQIQIG